MPPGPACLAESRLDFNEIAALRVETAETIRDCARQVSRLLARAERRFRQCLERVQMQHGQIWAFDSIGQLIQVYAKRPEASPRRDVVKACIDHDFDGPESPISIARRDPRVAECMRDRGWEPLFY